MKTVMEHDAVAFGRLLTTFSAPCHVVTTVVAFGRLLTTFSAHVMTKIHLLLSPIQSAQLLRLVMAWKLNSINGVFIQESRGSGLNTCHRQLSV